MGDMEQLLKQQHDAMYFVLRALDNFKKIGKANYTLANVRNRIAKLEDAFKESQGLHRQIVAGATPDHYKALDYFVDLQFQSTHDAYLTASDYMAEILNQLEEKKQGEAAAAANASGSTGQPPSIAPVMDRLPQLNLPTFSGDPEKWESFRDRFKSMIVNARTLSEVSKLQYLFSCLQKEPLDKIRNLAVTDANFKVAWDVLVRKYDNKRRLITAHVQNLLHLPHTNVESKTALNDVRDRANMAIQALKNLECEVDKWNEILVCLVLNSIDKTTRRAWELQLGGSIDFPSYEALDNFLENRIRSLDMLSPTVPRAPVFDAAKSTHARPSVASHSTTSSALRCSLCKANHGLNKCPDFREKSVSQRIAYVKQGKRCFNCLSSQHNLSECKSKYTCQKCKKRHHTLLHIQADSPNTEEDSASLSVAEQSVSSPVASLSVTRSTSFRKQVILASAWIHVETCHGRSEKIRALLDQGSVVSLITENLAQRLKAPRSRVSVAITGVGKSETHCNTQTDIIVRSCKKAEAAYSTTALIIKRLSSYLPPRVSHSCTFDHLRDLDLADDNPFSSEPIEMIIGADVYGLTLKPGIRTGAANEPVAQNTTLGWILSGPIPSGNTSSSVVPTHHCLAVESLDTAIRKFWEIEQIPTIATLTPAEQECENHFLSTHTRTSTGQYCVRLPFIRGPPIEIGSSFSAARTMWIRQENRLKKNSALADEYSKFMTEYATLHHMREVQPHDETNTQIVYIPHHAVIRESSLTTRLRVVFNASCHTSNGTSLNDHLHIGPKLQTELPSVILQWRLHRFVYVADIEKMYRQILVDERDIDYQRIVWRESPTESLKHFRLRTVTYGTASAPYLALRVMQQLAIDEGGKYPLALPVLRSQIYVDDCVFGANDKNTARETRDQLVALLKNAGFNLRKWASNCPTLLSDIPTSDQSIVDNKILHSDDSLKVLGVTWNRTSDSFRFNIQITETVPQTKRAILSTIAKFFDPLGWVTPVVITAKIFLQQLWILKCEWDTRIPSAILAEWTVYYRQLGYLQQLSIPRWIDYDSQTHSYELHGFSDASNSAYAAVVYLRVLTMTGDVRVSLLAAKSKVAPVKPMSVPRLELCAALLLSRLAEFLQRSTAFSTMPIHCWTDSTIVLSWVTQHPSRWKTFVANRVNEIQNNVPSAKWRHVSTADNPADCASRGLTGENFSQHHLWWQGPPWLQLAEPEWPKDAPCVDPLAPLEAKPVTIAHTSTFPEWELATRYSRWNKLLRVTAYILRFIAKLRPTRLSKTSRTSRADLQPTDALCAGEIHQARAFWLKYIQQRVFPIEMRCLQEGKLLPKKSALLAFNAYLDEDGLIRVGGRLQKTAESDIAKNPILLSAHPLTNLIVLSVHLRTLHGGPQLTLATLRQEFWILRAKPLIRAVLHRCVTCVRERANSAQELMGSLPSPRVNRTARAFLHCGVDYAGPILVRTTAGRGFKARKAYIALFVCLPTRAVHLELVSDYTTAAFLASFDRFVARRGLPNTMYSDNGTTFQGADKELRRLFTAVTRDVDLRNRLASDRINWVFISPSAPHFGGLWEAGIRSTKHHLKRVIGAHTLTFEELATVLCQTEACLNSRPIAPMSDNLDDYSALTPGHFLTGSATNAVPAPTLLDVREQRLTRWQLLRRMAETFWHAWSNEYLHTLQQRPKWKTRTNLAQPGRIVLLRNPLAPPCKWELGRITQCYPGTDGLTRVVTVKTARNEYRRPIGKLIFLPVEINHAERALNTDDSA